MSYMIEITEDKYDELSENIEKGLRFMGKAMQCIDSMKRERMGSRMPDYRDQWNEREDDERYNERRERHRY